MKANTEDQRRGPGLRRLAAVGAALAVLLTGACGSSPSAKPRVVATPISSLGAPGVLGDDAYLQNGADFVAAADWSLAKPVRIELGEMFFKPKDLPLLAGIPYVLELVNTGKVEHEFTAAEFFRSSSIRKIRSDSSEVRVPFFTGIKVQAGQSVKVYAIPVIPGTFKALCEIPGHLAAGMQGTITVTGSKPAVPAPVLASMKDGPWLKKVPDLVNAPDATWDAQAVKVRIEAGDHSGGGPMFFKPKELILKVGTPYVIQLVNVGKVLHEYTADRFFPTVAFRKASDVAGEYKSPLLKEAEVEAGKQLDLYLIPTKAGTFKIVCKLPDHENFGMVGKIKVTE